MYSTRLLLLHFVRHVAAEVSDFLLAELARFLYAGFNA
jgi:hypothetical protein